MNFISQYKNKIAVHFSRADFMLNGQENSEHFGPLQIKFQDNSYLTLEENGDAESITVSTNPIVFRNQNQPDAEYWTEIVLDNKPNWSEFLNSKLIGISLLQYIDQTTVGCRLHFDISKSITFYNYYDDAKVAFENDKLLSSFVDYEKLSWVDLIEIN